MGLFPLRWTQGQQEVYPQSPRLRKEGFRFSTDTLGVNDLLGSGCIVNYNTAAMKGKLPVKSVFSGKKHGDFVAGDVVVADSNFESFFMGRRAVKFDGRFEFGLWDQGMPKLRPFEGVCGSTRTEKIITLGKPKKQ